jgi:hypothetical protein
VSKPSRRLEDRIQELCAQAISETDPVALDSIMIALRSTVHQYVEQLRKRAAAAMSGVPGSTVERRKKTEEGEPDAES